MPEQKQTIVQPPPPPNKAKGARKQSNLQSMFPSSPIYLGNMTDEERKKSYQGLSLDGNVNDASDSAGVSVPGGPGHGVNSHDRDYSNAPDLSQVETGGGGLPASPYMPNLTSPGPGSLNAADQPEFNGELPDPSNRSNFGTGLGGLVSPSETAKSVSEQSTLEAYISGKSYLGSDGQV